MGAEHRNLLLATVLSAALGAAQAQGAKSQARDAAVADGVSSVVGIAAGAVNPVLPVLGVAFKAATFRHAESLPDTERPRAYAFAAAGWQGSAAGNVCAAASVLSGGSFLPACVVIGVAWGWNTWNASERERQDADRCAALRTSTHKPKLRCAVLRAHATQVAAPMPSFITAQGLVAP